MYLKIRIFPFLLQNWYIFLYLLLSLPFISIDCAACMLLKNIARSVVSSAAVLFLPIRFLYI